MIEEKQLLRKRMRALRRACTDRRTLDRKMTDHFLRSELYRDAQVLLLYASFDAEADTRVLIERALQEGKQVYLPYCVPDSNRMQFYGIDAWESLVPGAFGILTPQPEAARRFEPGAPTVCLVPGLAFSDTGDRLGYGRGYYDTFLEKIDVCTVGFCYSFQVVEDVPAERHDQRMRYLCTDQGIVSCAEKRVI